MVVKGRKSGFIGQHTVFLPNPVVARLCHRNPELSTLYITASGYYPKASDHYCHRPQGADFHLLIYCEQGSGYANLEGANFQIGKGDFLLLPANRAHFYGAAEGDPWTVRWISFRGVSSHSLMNYLITRIGGYQGTVTHTAAMTAMVSKIMSSLSRGCAEINLLTAARCLPILLSAMASDTPVVFREDYGISGATARGVDFMLKNLESSITIEEIARSANLSVSRFIKVFHENTGYSPIEYLNHLKIQRACNYLDFPEMKIREVALKIGIADPYYFSRLFTSVMGLSPTAFRQT